MQSMKLPEGSDYVLWNNYSPLVWFFEYGAEKEGYWNYNQVEDLVDCLAVLYPDIDFVLLAMERIRKVVCMRATWETLFQNLMPRLAAAIYHPAHSIVSILGFSREDPKLRVSVLPCVPA
jgi:hypothetical protein